MDSLLRQYLAVADPFLLGLTGAQMALGFPLLDGMRFPGVRGGYVLSRRDLYPTPGAWYFAGYQVSDAGIREDYDADVGITITSNRSFPHGVSRGYQYRVAAILGNGFMSTWSEPIRIDVDAAGALITAGVPLWPLDLHATPIAAGKYRVSWGYSGYGAGRNAAGARVWPYKFEVYEGEDAESIDYDTPLTDSVTGLAYTLFSGRASVFSFTTAAYDEATTHAFAVRAISAAGHKERNERAASGGKARTSLPQPPIGPGQIEPQGSS